MKVGANRRQTNTRIPRAQIQSFMQTVFTNTSRIQLAIKLYHSLLGRFGRMTVQGLVVSLFKLEQ